MSNTLAITPGIYKVAAIVIKVNHESAGNATKCLPVEFEVFKERGFYKAIPLLSLESRRLTGLFGAIRFEIESGKIYCWNQGDEEVVTALVNKMVKLGIDIEGLYQFHKAYDFHVN